jgi:hypothetical protein
MLDLIYLAWSDTVYDRLADDLNSMSDEEKDMILEELKSNIIYIF